MPWQVKAALGALGTTEARVAATALIVVAAVGLATKVVPWLVERLGEWLDGRLPAGANAWLARVGRALPVALIVAIGVTVLQAVVLGVSAWALLVVWGQVALAISVLALFELALPHLVRIGLTGVLVVAAYVGTDLLDDVVGDLLGTQDAVTAHQEAIVYRLSQIGLFLTLGLALLTVWNVDLGGLLVGAGFLGIVVGLAARQTLGALIAGFVLMFSRPFEIGDWVEIADEEGIVTDVTIINTRLRNFDGEYVVIPNDRVSDSVVTNRTREGRIRLRIEVGVDYESDPAHAADVACEAIEQTDGVAANPQPQVVPTGFGDSAVVLELRFWIERPVPQAKWRAVGNVVTEVKRAFAEAGITIPFPQRELSGRSDGSGFQLRGESIAGTGSDRS